MKANPPLTAGTHLSPLARGLLGVTAAAYLVTGIPLFVAPGWASDHFAWRVSPFVAMTAGAWCIGTAAVALYAVGWQRWSAVRPCVVYTFAFGVSQLGVALYERDLLRTGEVLTWPYLLALVLSVVAAGIALVQGRRHLRPDRGGGLRVTPFIRVMMIGFIALVFFLALVAFVAPVRGRNGSIFPEPLSLFSLRAFGVFYLSLGIAMLVIVADRRVEAFLLYMRGGLVLVAAILVATIVHADSFDLSAHPLQIVYPLAYLVALVGATGSLVWERRRRGRL
ncbi:MAG: hypothetical protein M3179_01355 [Actinomycetota bacterium]|nr:hypothetical protein [Actinomycetota bacterium]